MAVQYKVISPNLFLLQRATLHTRIKNHLTVHEIQGFCEVFCWWVLPIPWMQGLLCREAIFRFWQASLQFHHWFKIHGCRILSSQEFVGICQSCPFSFLFSLIKPLFHLLHLLSPGGFSVLSAPFL